MSDLLANVAERKNRLQTEFVINPDEDGDLEEDLDKLETELIDAIACKKVAQDLIQKYRLQVQEIQAWFETLCKKIDMIEKGNGMTIDQKIAAVQDISNDFDVQAPDKLDEVKTLGDQVMNSVSNLDSQQIEEQIKSVERKYGDIEKKLQRKSQVLDMTAQNIEATKREIESNRGWIDEKKRLARVKEPLGFESKQAEEKLLSLKVYKR